MNHRIIAYTALAFTHVSVLASLLLTSQRLPPRVASHFNAAGAPDGWMARAPYLWSMAGIAVGMSAFLIGMFYAVRYFPTSTINLPHRDYWLAPERREATFDALFGASLWLAALQAALLCGVHLLVVDANASQPIVLSSQIWWLLVGFVAAIIAWSYGLLRRFRRTS